MYRIRSKTTAVFSSPTTKQSVAMPKISALFVFFLCGIAATAAQLQTSVVHATALTASTQGAAAAEIAAVQISGRLWLDLDRDSKQDIGEPGIANHTVNLLDGAGASTGTSTTTAADGSFAFNGLSAGSYIVAFVVDGDYMHFALQDQGTDAIDSDVDPTNGRTPVLTLSDDQSIDVDAGVLSARGMGDLVWLDQDQDGRQDVGEPGFPGITVRLLNKNGGQVFDHNGLPYVQVTTDVGFFTFRDLLPSDYSIGVDRPPHMQYTEGNTPGVNGAQDSDVNPANGRTPAQELPSNDLNRNRDGGIRPGAVADRVWQDLNGNHLRDEGEPGISGILVKLISPGTDGTPNTGDDRTWFQTETAADGTYSFPAVFPIEYYISFELPSNGSFVLPNAGSDAIDSDADMTTGFSHTFLVSSKVSLADATTYTGVSAGYTLSEIPTATPTETALPPTETPTPTATSTSEGPTATPTATVDAPTATSTSEAPTATATSEGPTATPTATSQFPTATATTTPSATSTSTGTVTPAPTATVTPTVSDGPVQLSGGVYHDLNANGVKESDEPGVPSVIVTLSNGQAAITNSSGEYNFVVLAGDYTITQTDLAGYVSTGDADSANDNQIAVSVVGFPVTGLDFYDVRLATLQGRIIDDLNGNGLLDGGELGLAGVRVILSDGQETTTRQDGSFQFSVLPGTYQITVVDPNGYLSTGDSQGANDNQILVSVSAGATVINMNFFDQAEKTDGGNVKTTIMLPLTFR